MITTTPQVHITIGQPPGCGIPYGSTRCKYVVLSWRDVRQRSTPTSFSSQAVLLRSEERYSGAAILRAVMYHDCDYYYGYQNSPVCLVVPQGFGKNHRPFAQPRHIRSSHRTAHPSQTCLLHIAHMDSCSVIDSSISIASAIRRLRSQSSHCNNSLVGG